MVNKVKISGINTNDLEVLESDKTNYLLNKMKNGDKNARESVISGNLKLVLSILKRYKDKGSVDDLFQVGCIGLIKSVDNFDTTLGVKFSTYAVPMIDGEIRRYLRDNKLLRVSRSIKDLAYRKMKYEEKHGYTSCEELKEKLNVSSYELSLAEEAFKEPISIFKPVYESQGDVILLCDEIKDDSNKKDLNTHIALYDAINLLKDKEKFILKERYINGKTQTEIGNILDISQAQVSRIEKGAIKILKKHLKY